MECHPVSKQHRVYGQVKVETAQVSEKAKIQLNMADRYASHLFRTETLMGFHN